MDSASLQAFWAVSITAAMLFITGFYCILMTRNMMRALVGAELLIKAVTLLIIAAGYLTGKLALAQAIAITIIVIEVVIIAVACGIVLCIYRHTESLEERFINNLKG